MPKPILFTANAAFTKIETAISAQLLDEIDSNLTWIDGNVEFQNYSNSWRYNFTPANPIKHCFDRKTKTFPTGLLQRVLDVLNSYDIDFEITHTAKKVDPAKISMPSWMWEHQVRMFEYALKHKRGCIESPTGSGKSSFTKVYVSAFPDYPCLIVCNEISLVYDMRDSIQEYFDETGVKETVGHICEGETNWQRVTVSTHQSLSLKVVEFAERLAAIRILLFDEADCYANETGKTISAACPNASYRLGLSATLEKENGSGKVLEGVIGPTYLKIYERELIEKGYSLKPQVSFIKCQSPSTGHLKMGKVGNKPSTNDVYQIAIIENDWRNNAAIDLVELFLARQDKESLSLLVVSRIEHGHRLQKLCDDRGLPAKFIWGEIKGKKRTELLTKFKSGEWRCLIASKILNRGKDVPSLEVLVNLAGTKASAETIQRAGRLVRTDPRGKKNLARYYDFYDYEVNYHQGYSNKRLELLRERYGADCGEIITLEKAKELILL